MQKNAQDDKRNRCQPRACTSGGKEIAAHKDSDTSPASRICRSATLVPSGTDINRVSPPDTKRAFHPLHCFIYNREWQLQAHWSPSAKVALDLHQSPVEITSWSSDVYAAGTTTLRRSLELQVKADTITLRNCVAQCSSFFVYPGFLALAALIVLLPPAPTEYRSRFPY